MPFFVVPFIGLLFGTFVSACIASMRVARDDSVTQGAAAKAIVPTLALLHAVSGTILCFAIPML